MSRAGIRSSTPSAKLPHEILSFVGRSAELEALRRHLLDGERLVTLLGPPGVGKSRLALRHAHETFDEEVERVFWVDLDETSDPAELQALLCASLGASPPARPGEIFAALGPSLLVLDGAERAVESLASLLPSLLGEAEALRIVVTSVRRIGIPAEACVELSPLRRDDAIELYLSRAARVAPELRDSRDARLLGELVDRLDRLPLAIELAAARARVLRPRQLLSRLNEGRDPLRDPSTKTRHGSLQEAVRFAWSLLDPAEADLLAQASIFVSAFSLADAEAVLQPASGHELLPLLEGLRDKSLLLFDTASEPPLFSLLSSVRRFAREELERRGGAEAATHRHASHFASIVDGSIDGAPDAPTLRRLGRAREELIAAHGRSADRRLVARTALALAPLLAMQGPRETEARILEVGVAAAAEVGEPILQARLLRARALVALRHGRPEDAAADLEDSMRLALKGGDALVALHARLERGRLLCAGGRYEKARDWLQPLLDEAREQKANFLEAYGENFLGMAQEGLGRLDLAAESFARARTLFVRAGIDRFAAVARMNLGVARMDSGRRGEAEAVFDEVVHEFRALGDRLGEADALVNLGALRLSAGRLDDAEELLWRGLGLERELGNRRAQAYAHGYLGIVALERGEYRTARGLLSAGIDLVGEKGERLVLATFLPFLAAAQAALGEHEEALIRFEQARGLAEDPARASICDLLALFLDPDPHRLRALREGTDAAEGSSSPGELPCALRLAELALRQRRGEAVVELHPMGGSGDLEIGVENGWFRLDGAPPVDLRRRGAVRRIFGSLVSQRLAAPGAGLTVDALVESGWPGERMLPTAAQARVYVAIRTLRTMGLGERLLRQEDGYLLDPAMRIRRAGARF